jgi:hypothetical protein
MTEPHAGGYGLRDLPRFDELMVDAVEKGLD